MSPVFVDVHAPLLNVYDSGVHVDPSPSYPIGGLIDFSRCGPDFSMHGVWRVLSYERVSGGARLRVNIERVEVHPA